MLVVFDGRAQSVPVWLAASGFVLWEGVKLAGAQYRIPYVYKVSESVVVRLRCDAGRWSAACIRGALGNERSVFTCWVQRCTRARTSIGRWSGRRC